MSRLPTAEFPAIKPRQNSGQCLINLAPISLSVLFILKVRLVDAIALASKLIEVCLNGQPVGIIFLRED